MISLPTDKDYKAMSHKMSEILLPNEKSLSKIDGVVSFGLRVSKKNWKQIKMYFTLGNKLNIEEQVSVIQRIIALPKMTVETVEFDTETKEKQTAFKGQYIRPDKPR